MTNCIECGEYLDEQYANKVGDGLIERTYQCPNPDCEVVDIDVRTVKEVNIEP